MLEVKVGNRGPFSQTIAYDHKLCDAYSIQILIMVAHQGMQVREQDHIANHSRDDKLLTNISLSNNPPPHDDFLQIQTPQNQLRVKCLIRNPNFLYQQIVFVKIQQSAPCVLYIYQGSEGVGEREREREEGLEMWWFEVFVNLKKSGTIIGKC